MSRVQRDTCDVAPAGGVDGVPVEAVARHLGPDHAGTHGPGVDPDPATENPSAVSQSSISASPPYLERVIRTVPEAELFHFLHYLKR